MNITVLSGGVGGARMARGLATVTDRLTVITNVGDDDLIYGVHVAADLDTVVYTLAGREGPHGWGIARDTFHIMDRLAGLGLDTRFRLGDTDLATCLARTAALVSGRPLSAVTAELTERFGVAARVLPATDDSLRTRVRVADGTWLSFQEYFVLRGHRDEVEALRFDGADGSEPAPGVVEAIRGADLVVIAPSNPPLSIWPILAVPGIRSVVADAQRVVAVSPLFGGRALKGPADRVMASLGLPPGNQGVLAAYPDLLSHLVIDVGDADDAAHLSGAANVLVADTRIGDREAGARFATWLLEAVR